jgi:hypothetical protein
MTTTKAAESLMPEFLRARPHERIANPGPDDYKAWGNEMINTALTAGSVTAGATALYHLLNGFNSAQLPQLLRDETPADVIPAKPAKKKTKRQPQLKAASSFAESLGRMLPTGVMPEIPTVSGQPAHPAVNSFHESWRQLANIAAAGLGGTAGLTLIGSLAAQKRKKDLSQEVEDARQEYFDALTGKQAEALDAAFQRYKQANPAQPDPANQDWLSRIMTNFSDTANDAGQAAYRVGQDATTGLHQAAILSVLGTAGLGGMYMYNRTKDRTKAHNLRRAAEARARLKEIQSTPWVAADELVDIAKYR